MINLAITDLLESGAHFGHKSRYWDPRMKDYIFTKRHGIHIIDLRKTQEALNKACQFVYQLSANKNKILFIGTKRAAKKTLKEEAIRVDQPYVCHRWLGGMLTNYKTIRASVRRYQKLEKQSIDGTFAKLTKKEVLMKQREMQKLEDNIGGIKNMGGLPDALFVVDVDYEQIAVTEAKKIGLPIIGLVDTNSNPDNIDYVIPANDDAISSVSLLIKAVADAIEAGANEWKTLEEQVAPRIQVTDKVKKLVEEQEKEPAAPAVNTTQPEPAIKTDATEKVDSEKKPDITKDKMADKTENKIETKEASPKSHISAALVKELREKTGLGMMECKKALAEVEGDLDSAIELLRKAGSMKAAKKSSRVAAEGAVAAKINNQYGVLVEINTETDFVARDENFLNFVQRTVDKAITDKISTVEALSTAVEQDRLEQVQKIGENINIRRLVALQGEKLASYVHSNNRIGVLVALKGGDDDTARDLAMHIAASSPMVIRPEQVPQETVAKEKEIYLAQSQDSGKPQEIINKMVEGRVKKFLAEISLLEQPFVKQPDKTVGKLLQEAKAEVIDFVRFEVGEGIEKQETNFADEVASVIKG